MNYREICPVTPQLGDVSSPGLLVLTNGVRSEFAIPCSYIRKVDTTTVYEPIHLVAEGYGPPQVAFSGAPDGLSGTAWIDEIDDSVVRIALSAQCQAAVREDVTCDVSVTITRDTIDHGLRTDVIIQGPLTIKAAPFMITNPIPQLPANWEDVIRAQHASMLGYGVMEDFEGSVIGETLTISAGTAIVEGSFFEVGSAPRMLDLTNFGGVIRVILRFVLASRSIELAVVPAANPLVKTSELFELPIAVMERATNWTQPQFSYEVAGTLSDPVGSYKAFAATAIPKSHLIADGSAVSRVVYKRLFDKIATLYGVGDGATTFNLPDLRGRIGVGMSAGDPDFATIGKTGGEKAHVILGDEMPLHDHGIAMDADAAITNGNIWLDPNGVQTARFQKNGPYGTSGEIPGSGRTGNTGGGNPHNNLQPYTTQVVCIRA